MKLPSVRTMLTAARQTAGRFPFSIGFAVLGTAAALIVVDREIKTGDAWFVLNNVFLASTLGISLCAAAVFALERSGAPRSLSLLIQSVLAAAVVVYGLTLPHDVYSPPFLFLLRHWLLLLAVHLLVAFSAFTGKGEMQGFWQFNKSLFLRLLLAALYTGVLQAGLSVAIAAVDNLFELQVRPARYLELWIILVGLFNTWFFFAGVPEKLETLEADRSYPRGLKVFTQYVLLPLVVVYLLILYAYVVKIVVMWDWPKGWVANLILGFSITGIFSLLLVHPLAHREEERWIARFSRWFYVVEIPLVVVLLLAIGRRVQDYGITENRYFVVLLGLWLAGMTAYFLVRRNASIKAIPATLCGLALLSTFGPWSAFTISESSQVRRLAERLTAHGILVDGKIIRHHGGVPVEDTREISSMVTYLVQAHGVQALQPWFEQPLDSLETAERGAAMRNDEQVPRQVLAFMGVRYVPEWIDRSAYRAFLARRPAVFTLNQPGLVIRGIALTKEGPPVTAALDDGSVELRLSGTELKARFLHDSGIPDSLTISLLERVQGLYADSVAVPRDSIAPERMTIRTADRGAAIVVFMTRVDLRVEQGEFSIQRFDGDLVLGSRDAGRK